MQFSRQFLFTISFHYKFDIRCYDLALDTIKKAGSSLPKDVAKRLEKEVDELTKKFVKSAEDMCKAKEKEIAEG
ncbi:hypothetical protein CK203_039208 [Vitis vinifera]|uniref:Ribosome-recycling factor, chloroplastic n=1 Tax=Vitis vinifera TaxID=29760 RepID=A0A438H712_VITVI|nr:hypothetical protein CK203_039208 [Vitis vinifera]